MRAVLALLLLSGCQPVVKYIAPVGASICVIGNGDFGGMVLDYNSLLLLDEARDRAVQYWNNAGLQLDTRCSPDAARLVVRDLPVTNPVTLGETFAKFPDNSPPLIALAPITLQWASDGNTNAWHLVTHELGHALGFHHIETTKDSVMYPVVNDTMPDPPYAIDVVLAHNLMNDYGG